MRTWPPTVLLALLCLLGCASGQGSENPDARRDSELISLEELQNQPAGSAFDAVERLRPNWLRNRGPFSTTRPQSYPEVFVDDRHFGTLESLRQIDLDAVSEIRFLNGRDATTRFGTGYPGGLIMVFLKR